MTGKRRSTYRDAPGELGIHEDDLEPVEPVLPVARDHGYFTLDRVLGYTISSAVGAAVALFATWLFEGLS